MDEVEAMADGVLKYVLHADNLSYLINYVALY